MATTAKSADATADLERDAREHPLPAEAAAIDWDRLQPVEAEVRPPADGLACRLTVRFDGRIIDALAKEARRLGIGPATLVRMWTLERLQQGT